MYNMFLDQNLTVTPPEIEVITNSYKITSNNPQIVEYNTIQGFILYVRYNNDNLVCKNKSTNTILCSGMPLEYRTKKFIPKEQIEFYVEMYSQHKIKFI